MAEKKVLVLGTGKSGIAAAKLILKKGEQVLLYDSNAELDEAKVLGNFAADADIALLKGALPAEALRGVDCCVVSPGIPLDKPFVEAVRAAGIPIWGELELAYRNAKGALCAVTGTNGKTTTVSLIGAILRAHFQDVHVLGNIGEPYTAEALDMKDDSVTVLEVSSFQLETAETFHPRVTAVTNITPDHLDRHKTMENYIAVKESITKNQTKDEYVVLNYEDPELRRFGEGNAVGPKVLWFASLHELPEGLYVKDEEIHYRHDGADQTLFNVHEMLLLGKHNYENVMCAIGVTLHMGVPMETIVKVCKSFQPVEHRIEFVRERHGVRYYNDSKGTNVDAAVQALRAMPGPVLLIGGGYDKHVSFADWVKEFDGRVKKLVLLGQTREQIAETARAHGFTEISFAEDMEDAVAQCAAAAEAGDYVLLSPACASWGMFPNYEVRGRIFKDCVRALAE